MNSSLLGRPPGVLLPLILVDASVEYKADLESFLSGHDYGLALVSHYPTLEAWALAPPQRVHAVLFSDDVPGLEPATVSDAFAKGAERVVVLVTDPTSPRLKELRKAGAALAYKYVTGISLVEAVTAIAPRVTGEASDPTLTPDAAMAAAGTRGGGGVLTVYSPAGGSGKTLIATHLAAGYARERRRTVLVDLSQFGSSPPLFRVNVQGKSLSNLSSILMQDPDMATSPRFGEYLQQALLRVPLPGGGLDLLPPPAPSRADQVSAEHVEMVIRTLRALQYERIVIDTGSELTERTVAAIGAASLVLVPIPPDFQAAYRCLQLRDILATIGVPRNRVALVMNRWRTDAAFSVEEFREILRLPIMGMLPDAGGAAQRANNKARLLTGRWGLAGALARLQGAVEQGKVLVRGRD